MQTETKNNDQFQEMPPPVPPPAQFDEHQLADAKPVKPLPGAPWQKSLRALQRIFGRHVIVVAVIITGMVIGFSIATASLERASLRESSQDETVASTNQSRAEQASVEGETEPAPVVTDQETPGIEKTKAKEYRQVRRFRRAIPSFEFDPRSFEFAPGPGNGKKKARLVVVMH